MNRSIVISAAILICTSIVLGAFAAHGLKEVVNDAGLIIFEKGVKYQMYMGLGFLATGLAADRFNFDLKWFFITGLSGALIFSILLYCLAFKEHCESLKILGAFVPVGGLLMIVSWAIIILKLLRNKKA